MFGDKFPSKWHSHLNDVFNQHYKVTLSNAPALRSREKECKTAVDVWRLCLRCLKVSELFSHHDVSEESCSLAAIWPNVLGARQDEERWKELNVNLINNISRLAFFFVVFFCANILAHGTSERTASATPLFLENNTNENVTHRFLHLKVAVDSLMLDKWVLAWVWGLIRYFLISGQQQSSLSSLEPAGHWMPQQK